MLISMPIVRSMHCEIHHFRVLFTFDYFMQTVSVFMGASSRNYTCSYSLKEAEYLFCFVASSISLRVNYSYVNVKSEGESRNNLFFQVSSPKA